MAHWRSRALGFEICRFQLEVPARLAVCIIHEHHSVTISQSQGLLLDDLHILPNESRPQHMNDERDDRKPWKNIPRSAEVESAEILTDGRDCCAARQPVAAGANHFEALIG